MKVWASVLGAALSLVAVAQEVPPRAPYERLTVRDSDVCLGWNQREFRWVPDAAGSARTPGDTEQDAIAAAFRSWQVASELCSDFQFIRGEPQPDRSFGYAPGSNANDNVILFREEACRDVVPPGDPCLSDGSCGNAYRCWSFSDFTLAITLTSYSVATGAILDADIALNAGLSPEGRRNLFTTVDFPVCDAEDAPTCVATDVQNTLTHEIGHALGLDHVSTPGSTMELTAQPGETHKRVLDHGTRKGLCAVHPAGLPFTDCRVPSASLEVSGENTGTSLFGCAAAPAVPWLPLVLLGLLRRRR